MRTRTAAALAAAAIIALAAAPSAQALGYPSLVHPDFNGDFNGCNFSQYSATLFENGGQGFIDPSRVGEGPCAYRAHISTTSSSRAELSGPRHDPPFTETMELMLFVPAGVPEYGYVSQHKFDTSGCAQGGMEVSSSDFHGAYSGHVIEKTEPTCSSPDVAHDCGVYPAGRWFAVLVKERFATNGGGFVRCWQDADGLGPAAWVLKSDDEGFTTSDGATVKRRIGGYGSPSTPEDVWIDGVHANYPAG